MLVRLLLLVSLGSFAYAQNCSAASKCPSSAPCCSEYGYCGTGTFCLGGCAPLGSYATTSCMPNPICTNTTTDFRDLSRVQLNATQFRGNVSQYDWVVNKGHLVQTGDGVRLVLTQNDGGTKISSTRYIKYGKIDFVLETSKWAGVVTAAITMSDVKDEIDLEWPGTDSTHVQTNYWFLGIADYANAPVKAIDISSDSSSNFHTYSLDWQPEYLNWVVDGQVERTVFKSDTLNNGVYSYPSTPSRVQISIWPAGIPSSAQGTIDWSGGLINWQDPDYQANGYFWNTLQSVNIACATNWAQTNYTTGWAYSGNNSSGGVPDVVVTDKKVVLSGGGRLDSPTWTVTAALSLISLVALSWLLL